MFDDDDDFYVEEDDDYYDGPCMCSACIYRRAYWAGYYDALYDMDEFQ